MRAIIIIIIAMMLSSPSQEADPQSLGSFWMDPIKEWESGDNFTLWFRPEIEKSLHFCLNSKAKWTQIGNGELRITVGGWTHYWTTVKKDTTEITFIGSLPNKFGQLALVRIGTDRLKCGSEGITIQIQ